MAKILLFTYCVQNPDNSFAKREVSYNTGLLQNGTPPLTYENTTTITCSVFTKPAGDVLESYCALDANGAGVRREIRATGIEFTAYEAIDTADTACDGTCDLDATYAIGLPTTTTVSNDGTVRLDITTSNGPVTAYSTVLGLPSTNSLYTPAGVQPATYIIIYNNVRPGSYAIQVQDNANCQLTTVPIVVATGSASGTGTPGLPSGILWFKYQMLGTAVTSGTNIVTNLNVSGRAWNPTLKRVEDVAPIAVNYPVFNENTTRYAAGTVVKYSRVQFGYNTTYYHIAKSQLNTADFTNNKIPTPTGQLSDAYWDNMPLYNKTKVHAKTSSGTQITEYDYFYSPPRNVSQSTANNYFFIEDGDVVRYGWNGFYKARKRIYSYDYADGRIPTPAGVTDASWEKVNWFDPFYYVIPESDTIDRYTLGGTNYGVRYHTYDPFNSLYNPTSTAWVQQNATPGTPPQGNDYLLYDETIPTIETELGDLRVIDVTKNDIDENGAANGSVAIIATSPSLPIRFHLRNGVRTGYVQDNETGIYENLSAGSYVVDISDAANRYTSVEFTIEDNYGLRWRLVFDDFNGVPLELRVFEHGWVGAVTDVCGTGAPVELSWDAGSDPNEYLPESAGAQLRFELYTSIVQQFVGTIEKDDRNHRVDYYRNHKLQFRGFIDSTLYSERLLGAGQTVELIAQCGLGQLKNTFFVNHRGERQLGRTSMLSIVQKCLSYTDVNLPLVCGLNLRDRLMSADADPLLEAYVNRNAYIKKNEKVIKEEDFPIARDVIDALLRPFNALLFQADGCWKIVSLSEVSNDFATRVYSPAGTLYDATRIQLEAIEVAPLPVRILESQYATAARELYWINSSQKRITGSMASDITATVKLQLEENLFRNGDFVEWDTTNTRPLYWTKQGTPTIVRDKGENAKEYALKFSAYTTTTTPGNYLISPDVPHLDGQDEDGYVLKFRAVMEHTTTNPAELTATMNFQVVVDGTPYGNLLPITLTTKDKWKDYTIPLPLGMVGAKVRVRMLQPVATDAASVASTIRVNSVAIAIQPGLLDWSNQKDDFAEVINPDSYTGKQLDDLELVHADLPMLPGSAGQPLPPKRMDVFAWRHAVSLADFTATGAWKRPGAPTYATLLENAAQDRMAMRSAVVTILDGEVAGAGINTLRIGRMLDAPEDLDGKFMITSCFINERNGTATITALKIADGDYGDVLPELPDNVRIGYKNGKKFYRIAYNNGVKGYRVANP